MYFKLLLLWSIFFNILNANEANYSEEELLKKLFGKKVSNDVTNLTVPTIINGHGYISVKIDIKDDMVYLKKEDIKKILHITTIKYEKDLQKKEKFSIAYLIKKNIDVKYYKDELIIKINIPPRYLKTNTIIFNKIKKAKDQKDVIQASDYSGVSNFYIQQNYSDTKEEKLKRKDINIRNNFFLNLDQYILNGSLNYQENREKELQRGSFFLENDDTKKSIRYKLGEIYLPTHFRLSSQDSFGFSSSTILKLFKLNHKNTIRVNQYEFFIQNDSKVKLYINNIYKRSFDLRAGTHNFYDLYIPEGLSRVKLEITDAYGEMETIVFDDYKYSDILKKGTFLYGYGLGVIREKKDDDIIFHEDKYAGSFMIKYGLSDDITIESGAKLVDDKLSHAYDIYFGTKFGKLSYFATDDKKDINNIKNRNKEQGIGLNTKLADINLNMYTKKRKSYKDKQFFSTLDISYIGGSYNLTNSINLNGSYTYESSSEKKVDRYATGIDYNINDKTSLDLRYNKNISTKDGTDYSFEFSLTYKFGKTTYAYERGYENFEDSKKDNTKTTQSIKYRSKGERDFSIMAYNKDTTLQKSSQELDVRVDDTQYKLNTKYQKDNKRQDHLNISLQTAIAFAKDEVVITKPINNSFIIVSNNNEDKDNLVGVKNYPIKKSVVLTNNDYYTKKIELDESKLKRNYSLEKSTIYANSKYKSGTLVDISIPVRYTVKGILLDENKQALKFIPFQIKSLKTNKTHLTFTNAKGVFYLENLNKGKYIGTYINPKRKDIGKSFSFVIGDRKNGDVEINIGKIVLISN